jgi:hypothetical protein
VAQCYADKLAEKGENKINEQIAVEISIRDKVSSIVFELKNEHLARFQLIINCTYKNSSALYLIRSGLRGRLENRGLGFCGGAIYDSSSGCGQNRAVAGWPRSPGRPSAIRLT